VDIGETKKLYGSFPNVHFIDYPYGGAERIHKDYMDLIIEETALTVTKILNNYSKYYSDFEIDYHKLGWEERIRKEIELYEGLFE
jgi:hypothetical protein